MDKKLGDASFRHPSFSLWILPLSHSFNVMDDRSRFFKLATILHITGMTDMTDLYSLGTFELAIFGIGTIDACFHCVRIIDIPMEVR